MLLIRNKIHKWNTCPVIVNRVAGGGVYIYIYTCAVYICMYDMWVGGVRDYPGNCCRCKVTYEVIRHN